MQTLKQTIVILEGPRDDLEVRAGDITVNVTMSRGDVASVRVTRPPTDGRLLGITYSFLDDKGNPQTQQALANGWVDLEAAYMKATAAPEE